MWREPLRRKCQADNKVIADRYGSQHEDASMPRARVGAGSACRLLRRLERGARTGVSNRGRRAGSSPTSVCTAAPVIRRHFELKLGGLLQEGLVLHGGVERAPQRLDALGRDVGRQEERPRAYSVRANKSRIACRSASVRARLCHQRGTPGSSRVRLGIVLHQDSDLPLVDPVLRQRS